MKYKIQLDSTTFVCNKQTGEENDQIYITGFCVNDSGKVAVLPWRKIFSANLSDFKTNDSVSQLVGGNTLLKANLIDRRHLNFQYWFWIVESDDEALLKSTQNFYKPGIEKEIKDEVDELLKKGYKSDLIYFQATANIITDLSYRMRSLFYKHSYRFEIFNPAFIFCNAGHYLISQSSSTQMTDLNEGEYQIDARIKGIDFRLNNAPEQYNEASYTLYYNLKLIASGTKNTIGTQAK